MRGSIKRRGDRWTVRLDRGPDPATGARRQTCRTVRTRKEAEALLTQLLRERDTGSDLDPARLTVGELLAEWLETVARHRVRRSTWEQYEIQVRRHLVPALGHLPLARLAPLHLARLYARLADDGLAPGTIGNVHTTLHGALDQAVAWRLVAANVADRARPPRAPAARRALWDAADRARFVAALAEDELAALWLLALTTGLRRGELLGLRWGDVELDRATLAVARSRVAVRGGMQEGPPKSAAGRRQVALPAATVAALREHRRRQVAARLAGGPAWEDGGYVFVGAAGRPIPPATLTLRWRALLQRAALPHLPLRNLRHTHASVLLAAGVHVKAVQERLGHADPAITLRVYSEVTAETHRRVADLVDTLLIGDGEAGAV